MHVATGEIFRSTVVCNSRGGSRQDSHLRLAAHGASSIDGGCSSGDGGAPSFILRHILTFDIRLAESSISDIR
jgi:hypothetical protein